MGLLDILIRAQKIAKVDNNIVSQGGDDPADLDSEAGQCVVAAVADYSRDAPQEVAITVTCNAQVDQRLPYRLNDIVPEWDSDSHFVSKIFADLTPAPPIPIPPEYWTVRIEFTSTPSAAEVLEFVPGGGPTQDFGMIYTRPYSPDPYAPCYIPSGDYESVSYLAASKILDMAANYFARKSEMATMTADSVEYRSISARYAKQKEVAEATYTKSMAAKTAGAAWGCISWNISMSDGWPVLFHNRLR